MRDAAVPLVVANEALRDFGGGCLAFDSSDKHRLKKLSNSGNNGMKWS